MQAKPVPDWEPTEVGDGGQRPEVAESLVAILAAELEKLESEPLALHSHSDQQAKSQVLPSEFTNLISRYKVGIMGRNSD